MPLLLDSAAAAASLSVDERDAVQNALGQLRVKFKGLQDGMLLFSFVDGIESYGDEQIDMVMQDVVAALDASANAVVHDVVQRANRIGVV